ncbi:MAG: glycosyltransferase [Thermodesulfobacteriota bacterium]|nr:glycosyltransferase [Thermodesulfobacteriota bacterium]
MDNRRLETLALEYGLSVALLREYLEIFRENEIPVSLRKRALEHAKRIVMVSTHGYWGDPPPAGVPDTGGQTYYVLEVSKTWAQQGRKVIIIARHFKPYPRVERFAENLWLVRVPAGGDEFVRKEDIYPLVPELAENVVAVSALFGAHAVMGHYADGMTCALETGERLKIPVVVIPHSLGINKVISLGLDPDDPGMWFDRQYNFGTREDFELTSLRGSDFEIANTLKEPAVLNGYYGCNFPHMVMPAGAGTAFFDINKNPQTETLAQYGLISGRYFIYFGRFSEAKNVPGVVKLFGEAMRLDHRLMDGIKLVLVGGSPGDPLPEEVSVEKHVADSIEEYSLTNDNIVRLPSQPWSVLAILAHHCLSYIGVQFMEPFGMGVAEAMAASAPVVVSMKAGITKWIKDGRDAVVVDPTDPCGAARKMIGMMGKDGELKKIASKGHALALEIFNWRTIGIRQGDIIDSLCRGETPGGTAGGGIRQRKRGGRAYHRATFAWRGDPPEIRPRHERAAKGLFPYIMEQASDSLRRERRAIVVLSGESGAGKTEIAEYLRYLLRSKRLQGVTISGDAFFKLAPEANYQARLEAYSKWELKEYVGPDEVDLDRLDSILGDAADREVNEVFVPSDCRRLGSRRYARVPVSLAGVDVVLVDLTYGLVLKNTTMKIFIESDYRKRTAAMKKRNLTRDPDQDFDFILRVLEIEHGIIQGLRDQADIVVTSDYEARPQ